MTEGTITKVCTKCKVEKPLSAYTKEAHGKYGVRSACADCRRNEYRNYRVMNREKVLARSRADYVANRKKRNAKTKAWQERNRERVRQTTDAWEKANPERKRASQKEWVLNNRERVKRKAAEWTKNNPEKALAKSKRWKDKNKPRIKARKKAYEAANPEKPRAWQANRRARKLAAGGTHSSADLKRIYETQRGKCACCSRPLKGGWHADHIMPLVRGGTNERRNIQILCPPCNLEKHAKDPIDFMRSKGFLL